MSLTIPYIDYKTVRDNILTLLKANYTTINSGLTNTISSVNEQIIAGDPSVTPMPLSLYPVIMVKIVRKEEEFLMLGNAGRKRPKVYFNIYGITGKVEADTDAEIMLLTKNLESIFRDNIKITGTIYTDIEEAEFGLGDINGTYVDMVRISLMCMISVE